MDRFVQYLFLFLIPYYPLWAWFSNTVAKLYINKIVILLLIPIAVYYVIVRRFRFPAYLIFLSLFTIYHLTSVFINNLVPIDTNWLYFILSDINVFACLAFFIIENTKLDEQFIHKMNRNLIVIVIITLIVSVIQVKDPTFFLNPQYTGINYVHYLQQGRCFSIFNWVDLNSLGVTYPIIISILLSIDKTDKITFPTTIIAGIIVSFLSKARYIMLSTVIVFSQLFFVSKIDFRKKVYIMLILLFSVIAVIGLAKFFNYDIQNVIENRILERTTGWASAGARVRSYEVFLLKFPEHPLLGVGPATRIDVVQLLGGVAPIIHIGYLSYLYFYGIVGSLFLFLSLLFLLRNAWNVGRKHMFWGSFYGFLAFCFANMTFVYFNLSETGILLAVIYLKYFIDKDAVEKNSDKKIPVNYEPE